MSSWGISRHAAPAAAEARCLPTNRANNDHSHYWRLQMAVEDRGFASMSREKQRGIASQGGKAAYKKGTAHQWTREEARLAGAKGGAAKKARRLDTAEPPQ